MFYQSMQIKWKETKTLISVKNFSKQKSGAMIKVFIKDIFVNSLLTSRTSVLLHFIFAPFVDRHIDRHMNVNAATPILVNDDGSG